MAAFKPLRAGILNVYRSRQFLFTHHSYAATITHPRVQPTCQPLPTFSRVVGGPISNTPRLEVICPRPTHPLPKWIDTTGWEDEEERFDLTPSLTSNVDDTDWENSSEELDDTRQSLPLCMLSPDADDLPPPFFPPSRGSTPAPRTLASLSPGACNPPQPRFDSNPHPPIFVVNTQPSGLVAAPQHSPRSDSLEPTMFPGAWDAPPLNFEIYAQFGVGMFSYPSLPGCHPDQVEVRGARDHTRRGLGKGLWKVDG